MDKQTPVSGGSMKSDLTIRRARVGDEAKVHAFGRALWFEQGVEPAPYVSGVFTKYWNETYLRMTFTQPECGFIVAEQNNVIVGIAAANVKSNEPKTALLSRLWVLPSHHGRDIERALLKRCERALPRTVTSLLTSVAQRDESALHFYAGEGFKAVRLIELGEGEHRNVFVEMTKPIKRSAMFTICASQKTVASLN